MDGVEVWYLPTGEVRGEALLRACDSTLSGEERARGRALRLEQHRHEHLVTRALGRGVLARALGVAPSRLSFRRNAHGRPELASSGDLRFNLTNTTELVACAVARSREVGIDAEHASRADDILEVAHIVFTTSERKALAALDSGARCARALHLWTAKEAYVKARGLGLSLSPTKLELEIHEGRLELRLLEALDDAPGRWGFLTREIEGHTVTLCVDGLGRAGAVTFRRANLAELLARDASDG